MHSENFLTEVLEGLSHNPKTLSPKYFYDEEGSRLFEKITQTPEYYLTRSEIEILLAMREELKNVLLPHTVLIDLGSGNSLKTRLLLHSLFSFLEAYIPVDISENFLYETVRRLMLEYPQLPIVPLVADFLHLHLPLSLSLSLSLHSLTEKIQHYPKLIFFPGSTFGNFDEAMRSEFLKEISQCLSPGDYFLLGVDLLKDKEILERAYNDQAQNTAQFNLNLLRRMNKELGANFNLEFFQHLAYFNDDQKRIEMYLICTHKQKVIFPPSPFILSFHQGEKIHTENSYKFSLPDVIAVFEQVGLHWERHWMDQKSYFAEILFRFSP